MSEIQETDKGMRIVAFIGGIVAIIESFLELVGAGLMAYGFGCSKLRKCRGVHRKS